MHSRINVREIDLADLEQVKKLLRDYHAKTVFGWAEFSEEKFQRLAAQVYNKKATSLAAVAVQKENVCGFIWVSVAEYVLSSKAIVAMMRVLIIDDQSLSGFSQAKTALRLIELGKDWSRSRNASAFMMNFSGGVKPKSTSRISSRAGGILVGTNSIIKL